MNTNLRIYLAGGMYSNWRGFVKKQLDLYGYTYLDPMDHKLKNPEQYTFWDLRAIDACDILLGYMDSTNPSGYGLNVEIGYAKAKGKTIVLIVPYNFTRDDKRSKYFDMARQCADVNFHTISDAALFLKELTNV